MSHTTPKASKKLFNAKETFSFDASSSLVVRGNHHKSPFAVFNFITDDEKKTVRVAFSAGMDVVCIEGGN